MLKKVANYILWLGIAALLIFFSFRGVKWEDFWAGLKDCRWGFVLISMLFGLFSFFIRSLRWRELLRPIDASIRLSAVFRAINISYLVNLVLPRVGEFIRCAYINKHSRKAEDGSKLATVDRVFGTAVTERIFDMLMLALLSVSALLLFRGKIGGFVSENFSIAGKAVLGAALVATAVGGIVSVYLLRNKLAIFARLYQLLAHFWQGMGSCFKLKSWPKLIGWTLAVWGCYWLMSASIIMAVGESIGSLGMGDAFLLMIAGSLSSLVPVPGGFGAFHYVICLALSSIYGIPAEVGIIFATLSHESQAITQIICGSTSYIIEQI